MAVSKKVIWHTKNGKKKMVLNQNCLVWSTHHSKCSGFLRHKLGVLFTDQVCLDAKLSPFIDFF